MRKISISLLKVHLSEAIFALLRRLAYFEHFKYHINYFGKREGWLSFAKLDIPISEEIRGS